MAAAPFLDSQIKTVLKVAFDYEYDYKTRKVSIQQGEKLHLLQKTNEIWWKVNRPGIPKPFFVPAQYVTTDDDVPEESSTNDAEDDQENNDNLQNRADESIDSSTGSNNYNDNNNKESYDLPVPPPKVKVKKQKEIAIRTKSNDSSFLLKAFSKATKIHRNDGTRASHRDRERDRDAGKFSSSTKISSSSSGKRKNWSASLEELSRQIVFPGLASESIADLSPSTIGVTRVENKDLKREKESDEYFSLRDEENENFFLGSSSKNNHHSFHCDNQPNQQHINSINQCLTFRNPTFSNSSSDSSRDNKMKIANSPASGNHSTTPSDPFDWESHIAEKNMESDCNISRSSTSSINKDGRLPSPPKNSPVRRLAEYWAEYYCSDTNRYFYYNSKSKTTSWKPPRISSNKKPEEQLGSSFSDGSAHASSFEKSLENISDLGLNPNLSMDAAEVPLYSDNDERSSSMLDSKKKCSRESRSSDSVASNSKFQQSEDDNGVVEIPIPNGWETQWDEASQQSCYVNKLTGARWFASTDPQERVYFYEENTNNSSWLLPVTDENQSPATSPTTKEPSLELQEDVQRGSTRLKSVSVKKRHSAGDTGDRNLKTKSLLLSSDLRKHELDKSGSKRADSLPRSKLSIWANGQRHDVVRDGPIARSKITENGKKLRKSWGVVWCVISETHLSLFKDQKSYNTLSKTEMEIELDGAIVEWTEEKSSRKNVFQLSSPSDLQMLFQVEDKELATEWFEDIKRAIQKSDYTPDISMRLRSTESPESLLDPPVVGERKMSSRLGRNKSTKIRITTTIDERSERGMITAHLKKFFSRRPPRESLVKKGIYKDESVFGCSLEKLCALEKRQVPRFVEECILAIEGKPENLKTDGLYRASGNLSQVQKIRFQIDQNNMMCLIQEEDVHVLAGCLKLFFRELKEPLIPPELFEKGLEACNAANKKDKVHKLRDVISSLPKPNRFTLQALLKHLLNVSSFSEFNRMQIPNLAIVFGPTLMCAAESQNMAILMQQNYVIEFFLKFFNDIFLG